MSTHDEIGNLVLNKSEGFLMISYMLQQISLTNAVPVKFFFTFLCLLQQVLCIQHHVVKILESQSQSILLIITVIYS